MSFYSSLPGAYATWEGAMTWKVGGVNETAHHGATAGRQQCCKHGAVLPPWKTGSTTLDHNVGRRHNLRLALVKRALNKTHLPQV